MLCKWYAAAALGCVTFTGPAWAQNAPGAPGGAEKGAERLKIECAAGSYCPTESTGAGASTRANDLHRCEPGKFCPDNVEPSGERHKEMSESEACDNLENFGAVGDRCDSAGRPRSGGDGQASADRWRNRDIEECVDMWDNPGYQGHFDYRCTGSGGPSLELQVLDGGDGIGARLGVGYGGGLGRVGPLALGYKLGAGVGKVRTQVTAPKLPDPVDPANPKFPALDDRVSADELSAEAGLEFVSPHLGPGLPALIFDVGARASRLTPDDGDGEVSGYDGFVGAGMRFGGNPVRCDFRVRYEAISDYGGGYRRGGRDVAVNEDRQGAIEVGLTLGVAL